jgi:hypothetical protein
MNDAPDPDEPLVADLRALFATADPVPPLVTEAAKAALGWRRLDAELAELLSDSAVEDDALALARGGGAPVRSVSFGAGELTIDIEVHHDGERLTVLGQLSPPSATRVEIQHADGDSEPAAQTDALGRFRARLTADGPIRLIIGASGDGPGAIETSWIVI